MLLLLCFGVGGNLHFGASKTSYFAAKVEEDEEVVDAGS